MFFSDVRTGVMPLAARLGRLRFCPPIPARVGRAGGRRVVYPAVNNPPRSSRVTLLARAPLPQVGRLTQAGPVPAAPARSARDQAGPRARTCGPPRVHQRRAVPAAQQEARRLAHGGHVQEERGRGGGLPARLLREALVHPPAAAHLCCAWGGGGAWVEVDGGVWVRRLRLIKAEGLSRTSTVHAGRGGHGCGGWWAGCATQGRACAPASPWPCIRERVMRQCPCHAKVRV